MMAEELRTSLQDHHMAPKENAQSGYVPVWRKVALASWKVQTDRVKRLSVDHLSH